MSVYKVDVRWGGNDAPRRSDNMWLLGGRNDQLVMGIKINSKDKGKTFQGEMTYEGEGPIDFKASHKFANVYSVEVRWGGSTAPWHHDGTWIIGGRTKQRCVSLNVKASGENRALRGAMTYDGEGPIDFQSDFALSYQVDVQWGGSNAPWHSDGIYALSGRLHQEVTAMDISSTDNGKTLNGSMTYKGEGPIGFKGTLLEGNNYEVSVQWGGSSAPWHRENNMIIGNRDTQRVVKLKFTSVDGEKLKGEMAYNGEGDIAFKAELVHLHLSV